jgi:methylated-DNA-[protein]-cysteine S-methyltransferase
MPNSPTPEISLALAQLKTDAPQDLYMDTVLEVGAADRAARTDSPIGPVWIAWSTRGVTALSPLFEAKTFDDFLAIHRREAYETTNMSPDLGSSVARALDSGESVDIAVDLSGLGSFQQTVLAACSKIPVGQVRPYGWIANEIHNPGSVRAVGTALAKNPVPLLVPCHRVVKADGSIGNYAFGAETKHQLLVREGALLG